MTQGLADAHSVGSRGKCLGWTFTALETPSMVPVAVLHEWRKLDDIVFTCSPFGSSQMKGSLHMSIPDVSRSVPPAHGNPISCRSLFSHWAEPCRCIPTSLSHLHWYIYISLSILYMPNKNDVLCTSFVFVFRLFKTDVARHHQSRHQVGVTAHVNRPSLYCLSLLMC